MAKFEIFALGSTTDSREDIIMAGEDDHCCMARSDMQLA